MVEMWKYAIGLAGLAAVVSFVFWSLYKSWLKLPGIFERQNGDQTYRLFRLFLVLTFLFALAGLATYLATRMNNGNSVAQATLREAIDTLHSREDTGLDMLRQKQIAASTTQAAEAAKEISGKYKKGMDDVIDALKKGEVNRAMDSHKNLIEGLHDPNMHQIFTPIEQDDFINRFGYFPKEKYLRIETQPGAHDSGRST